ncbi:alkaline phosphatase family protein [Flexithrix dorotheae]|uniref:alkaline phosphatase family protein n=1 Tax=Flexithrix dorotheae TaxID=70993 RepID=UPI00036B923C|nr:alkaline phosphatase [Flexithrix dorotheae]
MKKIHLQIVVVFIIFGFFSCQNETKTNTKSNRVVVIGLDGLSVEGYQKSKHPNLDKLLEDGSLSLNTRCVMPSVTLPNWTSHLTSGGPEQHGVTGNDWRLDNHQLSPIERDSLGYYPSIFKILKEQIPHIKTAYYYNWGNLINPINKLFLDEINFEKDDKYVDNYRKAFEFINENKENPTFVFLYSVHVDHAGHEFNWMSPEYISSIEEVDVEIGHFINKLKSSGLYESTHFLLITDHGGISSGHGGLSEDEMEVPWGITGPGIAKGKIIKEPNSNANTAAVISVLFGCSDLPKSWIGKVPESIFE